MKVDRNRVYAKFGGRCGYCGREIAFKEMQVDHMYCLRREKSWLLNYKIDVHNFENLMPACRKCNHYKRAHSLQDFRTLMMSLHVRLSKIYIVEVACNFGMAEIKPFDGKFYFETILNNLQP